MNTSSQNRPSDPVGLLWAAASRVQATHLIVFGVLPLSLSVGRFVLTIFVLPFLLLSFGHRDLSVSSGVEHLRAPQS